MDNSTEDECEDHEVLEEEIKVGEFEIFTYTFFCQKCGETFETCEEYKDHIEIHRESDDNDEIFACTICKIQFNSRNKLTEHALSHKRKKSFVCDFCQKEFAFFCRLRAHVMLEHENVRKFECKICDKKFKHKCHLESHLGTHIGISPFSCIVCNQKFKTQNCLYSHRKKHSKSEIAKAKLQNNNKKLKNEIKIKDEMQCNSE